MTATHKGYHAFTASNWLVAKEPDHLTTCNTVETERVLFTQRSTMQKKDPKLYMRARAVPINIEPSNSVKLGISIAIVKNFDDLGQETPEWNHYEDLHLSYIREQIRLGVIYEKIRNKCAKAQGQLGQFTRDC